MNKKKSTPSSPTLSTQATDLERNPHLFKYVIDASGMAFSVRNRDLHPIFANQAFLDLYGYTLEELRGTDDKDILPEATCSLYDDVVKPLVLAGKSWEGEYAICTKPGRLMGMWGRFDPIKDDDGTVTHVVSTMRDASASRRLRNALTQTERHLQFLTANTSDCLFRQRLKDGRYDYISSAVTSITGYTPQQFYEIPNLFERQIPASWTETHALWRNEFLKGESRPEYEMPVIHKDGSLKWLRMRITMVRDDDNTPIAIEGIMTDATDHKQAEDALLASERQYRLLTETIEDVIWTLDNNFRYTYVSPAITQLVGFTPAEYCQMSLEETMTPESMDTVKTAIIESGRAEKAGTFDYVKRLEIERLHKDGTTVWVESITRRLLDDDGAPTGFLGITRDISPRKKWENALKENESRFRTLFEDSPISLWEEDLTRLKAYFDKLKTQGITDFREHFYAHPEDLGTCARLVDVVDVNKATLDLLKARTKKELLGNLDKVLTESSMAAFTEEMILLASGGCEYCGEITHRTLDGDIIWVMVHFSVPPEYQDTLSRVIVSLQDVTPRKRAEQALMDSEERYRVLVENAQEGVVVTQDGMTKYINEAMSSILGFSTEELNQIHPLEMAHPSDKALALNQLRNSVSGGTFDGMISFRVNTKKGQTKWLTLNVKPITWEGREAQLEILTDVTVHKTLEKKLRAAYAATEDRVRKRTMELSEANTQLKEEAYEREKAQQHILYLTQQLIRIQEDERQRIARDLHDNVAQDLSSLVLQMETLFDGLHTADDALLKRGEAVAEVLRGAIASVRDIAYGLRPPALDQLGLVKALENYCQSVSDRSRLDVDFFAAGIDNISLDFDTEINIYRMVQEAVANTVKHAEAAKATVRMVKSHPDILVRIDDNGQGFDVHTRMAQAVEERRMGLKSMEERARLIGGSMEIRSRTGTGTRIMFKVPITQAVNKE